MFFAGKNVVFIHVPKTGGNHFARTFIDQSSDRLTAAGHQDGVDRFEVVGDCTKSKHQDLCQYHAILGERLGACRVWATYRDPVERMVSLYFSPHRWMKRNEDGCYVPPPDDSVFFDLDEFRKVVISARSTWQLLDCANMIRLPGLGMTGQHRSGAAVHLFAFGNLQAQSTIFAETEGLDLSAIPDRIINRSTVARDRAQGICGRQDVMDLVLASHHGQDLELAVAP